MITIFALVSCFYVNGELEVVNGAQNCRVWDNQYFNSLAACEDYRARFIKDMRSGSQQMKFSCWHKEAPAWQR
jgi:hypothetical protein